MDVASILICFLYYCLHSSSITVEMILLLLILLCIFFFVQKQQQQREQREQQKWGKRQQNTFINVYTYCYRQCQPVTNEYICKQAHTLLRIEYNNNTKEYKKRVVIQL